MVFKAIPVPESDLTQWYAYDNLGGFHALVTRCEDKSGWIGHVVDHYTGEKMTQFIGSTVKIVQDAITDYVNTLTAKGFISSL